MNPHNFLIAVSLVSCLSCILITISFATDHWIEANVVSIEGLQSNVSYGLFKGAIYSGHLLHNVKFTLTLVCDFYANACIYSCQQNKDSRHFELKRVIQHLDLDACDHQRSTDFFYKNSSKALPKKHHTSSDSIKTYIAATLHLCTVMFLSLGLVFSLITLICSFINLKWHSSERILNIYGLYIWNSIAAGCCFWCIALWTALFYRYLRFNIAITDTLRPKYKITSKEHASLGFSYCLILVSIFLDITNVVLLFLRRYGMEQESRPSSIVKSSNDDEMKLEFN